MKLLYGGLVDASTMLSENAGNISLTVAVKVLKNSYQEHIGCLFTTYPCNEGYPDR